MEFWTGVAGIKVGKNKWNFKLHRLGGTVFVFALLWFVYKP